MAVRSRENKAEQPERLSEAMNGLRGQLQEGNRGRRTVVKGLRNIERADLRFYGWSMRRRHRKQYGAQVGDGLRHNNGIRRKMLSHRMRRIRLDARTVEIEAVENAGGHADGNREDGEQHYQVSAREPAASATKQIGFPPHLFQI